MKKFEKPNYVLTCEENKGYYGKFEIQHLERGFATTLGNSLRRVLLSSIPGSSIFGIKIEHVAHEFMALDGIEEDITQIILNLKDLVISIDDEDENIVKQLNIDVKGPCTVTGRDIVCSSDVKVHNEDIEICHLTSDVEFHAVLFAKNGRGYVSCEDNRIVEKANLAVGTLPTDSTYTPVTSVAFAVEQDRNIRGESKEKLVLEITTNGSCEAKTALSYAAKILVDHFLGLVDADQFEVETMEEIKEVEEVSNNEELNQLIENSSLSRRSKNSLQRVDIKTVGALIKMKKDEIGKIRNLGKKSEEEIVNFVEVDLGLKFAE